MYIFGGSPLFPPRIQSSSLHILPVPFRSPYHQHILYDKDRNVIGEGDIAKGLKEIVEYHMNKLKKRLDMFIALASTEDKDGGDEMKRQRAR